MSTTSSLLIFRKMIVTTNIKSPPHHRIVSGRSYEDTEIAKFKPDRIITTANVTYRPILSTPTTRHTISQLNQLLIQRSGDTITEIQNPLVTTLVPEYDSSEIKEEDVCIQHYPQDLVPRGVIPWGEVLAEYDSDDDKEAKPVKGREDVHVVPFNPKGSQWYSTLQSDQSWKTSFPGSMCRSQHIYQTVLHFNTIRCKHKDVMITKEYPYLPLYNNMNLGYDIIPISIHLIEERSTLPFPVDIQLFSTETNVAWFNVKGYEDGKVCHHITYPGITSVNTRELMYAVHELRPEFCRWVGTTDQDWSTLMTTYMGKNGDKYHIPIPDRDGHTDNVMQFLCMDEWQRLIALKRKSETPKNDTLKLTDKSFIVSKQLLEPLIEEKKQVANRKQMIMPPNGLRLELHPVKRTEYLPLATPDESAMYHVKLLMHYVTIDSPVSNTK